MPEHHHQQQRDHVVVDDIGPPPDAPVLAHIELVAEHIELVEDP